MKPQELHNKRILFSPLNWGMGHVSRSIGLIDALHKHSNEVIIACNSEQRKVYENYYADIQFIEHEGYPFHFGGKGKFAWDLFLQLPSLKKSLNDELRKVAAWVEEFSIDVVIADHRYGFRSEKVPSIFVTHQYNLPVKWYEAGVNAWHKQLMGKFDTIWIMDTETSTYAGELSATKSDEKAVFIGIHSRFERYAIPEAKSIDTCVILSGPSVYAQQLLDQLSITNEQTVIIGNSSLSYPTNAAVISDDWLAQDQAILNAKRLISRSGYSTIMDAAFLKVDTTYIPTKGQREQEYLAQCATAIT